MVYLKILRAVALITFLAGCYWLAFDHHQVTMPGQAILVLPPLS
jgi:hypothetical protein